MKKNNSTGGAGKSLSLGTIYGSSHQTCANFRAFLPNYSLTDCENVHMNFFVCTRVLLFKRSGKRYE